jgi:uncharacterized alkaline shock family protein YloU
MKKERNKQTEENKVEKVELRDVVGSLRVSEDVLLKIAATAAAEVDGVKELAKFPLALDKGSVLPRRRSKSVSLDMADGLAAITVSVIIEAEKSAAQVSKLIQQNVKQAVQNMTGVAVSKVNVYVHDISL